MSVSNKTLAVMLLAAIVVSLGGTFISLNKLGSISTTGYQTFGTVELNISTSLSITTDGTNIDFGACSLGTDAAGITINSETAQGNVADSCADYVTPTYISIRNNGNLNAEVTFNVTDVGTGQGGTFLNTGDTNSSIAYKLQNIATGAYQPGCAGTMSSDNVYVNFSNTNEIGVCTNLTTGTDSIMRTDYEIVVPTAASEGDTVTITFFAQEAG